jgi:hypothetical protein
MNNIMQVEGAAKEGGRGKYCVNWSIWNAYMCMT